MTYEISNVQRLRLKVESNTQFGVDQTSQLTTFLDVPCIEGSITATQEQTMLDPETIQQHLDGYPTQLIGLKRCALSFSMLLAPTGNAATTNLTASSGSDGALGALIKACLGGSSHGKGTTASGTVSTTHAKVASTTTSVIKAGQVIGANKGSANVYEMREVEAITGTTGMQLKMALSNAFTTGAIIHGCSTYFLTQDPDTSLQAALYGAEVDDRWLYQGLQLESLAIEMPIGQLPKITFALKGVTYTHGASATTNFGTGAIAQATYTKHSPVHVTGEFLCQTVGTATRPTPLPVSSVTYAPAVAYGEITDPSGVQAVKRKRRLRTKPVLAGTFVLPYEDTTYEAARLAKTLKYLAFQFGNLAGKAVLVSVPTAQIVNVQLNDVAGIRSQTVSYAAQLDSDTTEATATDQGRSAFRIALG